MRIAAPAAAINGAAGRPVTILRILSSEVRCAGHSPNLAYPAVRVKPPFRDTALSDKWTPLERDETTDLWRILHGDEHDRE